VDVACQARCLCQPGQGYSAEPLHGVARDRGWPEPEIYADAAGPAGPGGLVDLIVSVASGRRYELLLAVLDHSDPVLGQLLTDCARLGTAVSLRSEHGPSAVAGGYGWSAIGSEQGPERGEPGSTLELARLEALTSVFPRWQVWRDHSGWHARRRGARVQSCRDGAPAFHVHAGTATELAAQLCWQHHADTHVLAGPGRGRLVDSVAPAGEAHG
jgi:hypothetical protein